MPPSHVVCTVACAVAITGAGAATAGAATLTADQACYIERQGMGLSGAGFAADAAISISGEQVFLSGAADAAGAFGATVRAPSLGTVGPKTERFKLTATDQATNTAATVDVQVATGAFATSTGFSSPRTKRTWTFSGLFQHPGKPIYGHFRNGGRTYANYRFGVPSGPCGTLKRRAPGIPSRSVPSGLWTVQVDFRRTYSATTKPRLKGSTTVFKTLRRR